MAELDQEQVSVAQKSILPSVGRQKSFIIENSGVLNHETKLAILSIVMMEIGDQTPVSVPTLEGVDSVKKAQSRPIVTETKSASGEVDIDLDIVAEVNPEVLAHIYNIVVARLDILNRPAKTAV